MAEVKQRRKANLSAKSTEDQEKTPPILRTTADEKSGWRDPRTASSLLSLIACVGLTWFLFQQSAQLAEVEEKYYLLKQETAKFQDTENKIILISEKFESSSGILKEASFFLSMVTKVEQEVSNLRNRIRDIQNSEQALAKRMQTTDEKFQNIIKSWEKSQTELDTNTSSLKSEARLLHVEVTSQINAADQKLKSLSERLKDLEDSTVRNLKTLSAQEEDELAKVEQQLQSDTKEVGNLEVQQNSILVRNDDMRQKLAGYETRVEECKTHLPAIENAIRSVVRLSRDLTAVEKKMEDMTIKVFSVEDEMMKAVSDIMDIQKTLEGMQYDNSLLKLQNEVLVLKEKIHDFAESTAETEKNTENYYSVNDE